MNFIWNCYRGIFSGQIQVYQDQVRQFSITIIQLEKNFSEEQEKRIRLQSDLDQKGKTLSFLFNWHEEQTNERFLSFLQPMNQHHQQHHLLKQ